MTFLMVKLSKVYVSLLFNLFKVIKFPCINKTDTYLTLNYGNYQVNEVENVVFFGAILYVGEEATYRFSREDSPSTARNHRPYGTFPRNGTFGGRVQTRAKGAVCKA